MRRWADKLDKVLEKAAKRGAEVAREIIARSGTVYTDKPWPPLSEATIAATMRTKPLIDTGGLMESIEAVRVSPKQKWAVKVSHPAAPFHEFGAKIRVSDEMRDTLRKVFQIFVSPNTRVIEIPERPFMRPMADQVERELLDIAREELGSKGFPLPIQITRPPG